MGMMTKKLVKCVESYMQIRLSTIIVLTLLAGAMLPLWMLLWNFLAFDGIDDPSLVEVFFGCFIAVDSVVFLFGVGYFLEYRMDRRESEASIRAIQAAAKQRAE